MTKNKHKKGQIAGQIFIYIVAAIVIGGIALVGYKAISSLSTKACQAEKATFNNNLEAKIENGLSSGSVKPEYFKAPCDYEKICFVATSSINLQSGDTFKCPENKIIEESVKAHIEQNIFVISSDRTIPIGYSDIISLNDTYTNTGAQTNCLCIKQRNHQFYITFKGKESTAEIVQG